ncbi:unnamed protein product [Urochloa decumbens]|uniref:BTB/POZ and MATH domain-containing protein 1 n=1 Tax=Urochloa decumbens TaxID=240449 RepID=A0ABC8XY10_9POAL
MPPAERAAVDLGGTFSASAIVGGTVTGHHLLHIDCYSQTKEELPTGKYIKSCPFSAGGRSWYIKYYPNGDRSSATEFISIYLQLDQSVAQPVKARLRFSLLDQAGESVPSHSRKTPTYDFFTASPAFGYREFIKRAWLEESKYLKDDRFTIRCSVIVTKELCAEERRPVVVPPSNLHRNLGDLLASGEGSDVTFQVLGETFKAHSCVLVAQSPVFKAEVLGAMKESINGSVIQVDDIDADVFRALLKFMYTDTLPDFQDTKKKEEAAMAQHLLVAADRYNLERLKLICEDRLCGHIDTASAASILALAEQHSCRGLKEACFRFLSSPSALNAVMTTDGFDHLTRSCPSVLKELMANIAACVSVDLEQER